MNISTRDNRGGPLGAARVAPTTLKKKSLYRPPAPRPVSKSTHTRPACAVSRGWQAGRRRRQRSSTRRLDDRTPSPPRPALHYPTLDAQQDPPRCDAMRCAGSASKMPHSEATTVLYAQSELSAKHCLIVTYRHQTPPPLLPLPSSHQHTHIGRRR